MSHITDMKLRVRDLDALDEAARESGLELVRGQTTHRWYGRFVGDSTPPAGRDPALYGRCDHALRVPGDRDAYEIGVVKALDGDGFDLLLDIWGPGRRVVPKLGKLRQEYAVAQTLRTARAKLARQGYSAQRENLPDGRVRVRLVRR